MNIFVEFVKGSRFYRTIPVLLVMLVSAAFTHSFTVDIATLMVMWVLLYASISVHNSLRDNDFRVTTTTKALIAICIGVAFLLSLSNPIIFMCFVLTLVLGYIYNTSARKVLFGDASVMSLLHFGVPSFCASLVVGVEFKTAILLSVFFTWCSWFLIHTKNLKDTEEDKQREYATVTTRFEKGTVLTLAFFYLFMLSTVLFVLFYAVSPISLTLSLLGILLGYRAVQLILRSEYRVSLCVMRVMLAILLFAIVVGTTVNPLIIVTGLTAVLWSGLHHRKEIRVALR